MCSPIILSNSAWPLTRLSRASPIRPSSRWMLGAAIGARDAVSDDALVQVFGDEVRHTVVQDDRGRRVEVDGLRAKRAEAILAILHGEGAEAARSRTRTRQSRGTTREQIVHFCR